MYTCVILQINMNWSLIKVCYIKKHRWHELITFIKKYRGKKIFSISTLLIYLSEQSNNINFYVSSSSSVMNVCYVSVCIYVNQFMVFYIFYCFISCVTRNFIQVCVCVFVFVRYNITRKPVFLIKNINFLKYK